MIAQHEFCFRALREIKQLKRWTSAHIELGVLRGPVGFTRSSGSAKEREVEGSHPEVVHTPKIILSTFH